MCLQMSIECNFDQESKAPSVVRQMRMEKVPFLCPLGTMTWSGASGRHVPHVIYSLIGCPAAVSATYILVRRSADGRREVLAVRSTRSTFATANLARIRRTGARIGANEVHLFRGAQSDQERRELVSDLSRALRRHPRKALPDTHRSVKRRATSPRQ
jgi:hypothetical protein